MKVRNLHLNITDFLPPSTVLETAVNINTMYTTFVVVVVVAIIIIKKGVSF